jgi:hypothetical protein
MTTSSNTERGLELAIDALYRGSLETFTHDRNALSAELRKGGDRAAADRVKALPKPSLTAWAVNQVWWTNRPVFEGMVEAGARLKKAHLTWSGGGAADVRAAAEERRHAVRAVVDAAVAALGDPKSVAPDMQYRISGTVEALASGEVSGVTPGRLSKDVQTSGLEGLGALAAAAVGAPPRPGAATSSRAPNDADRATARSGATRANESSAAVRPAVPSRPTLVHSSKSPAARPDEPARRGESAREAAARRRAQELEKVEARLQELEARLDTLTKEAMKQSEEETRARTAADAARAGVTDLERQLDEAREREKAARRTMAEASKAASETEMVRARTARDVGAARAQRDALRPG